MILFDLNCGNAHVFEAWFRSSADYEDQQTRGLIACPICNDAHIGKAVMAAHVGLKGNQRSARPPVPVAETETAAAAEPASRPVPAQLGGNPEAVKAMLHKLAEVQTEALSKAENVGGRFAEEARAIHYGETDERHIYGETSLDEARSLYEEGIRVAPLLFPIKRQGDA